MKISVALCTYNGEKYIAQQLESIFSQSVAVSEIVICDDCSSDGTILKVEYMNSLHPGVIKVIINPHNIGFRKNFEQALRECKGDFIFLCDQDDVWRSDKVEKSIEYLQSSGNYGVFTDANLIDEDGEELGLRLFECLHFDQYIRKKNQYPDLFTTLCLSDNFVTGATMALSKEAKPFLLSAWPLNDIYHDYYIALRLSAIGKLGYLPDRLVSYRIHPSQQIGLSNVSSQKCRLFDYEPHTDGYDCIRYLFYRRRIFFSICSVCCLGNKERRYLKKSYRLLLYSTAKDLHVYHRLKVLLLFCYIELKSAFR